MNIGRTKVINQYALNQYVIKTDHGVIFQSYSSRIAFIDDHNRVYLDKNTWDYSRTTGKYRNKFLREGVEDTRKKIKLGIYKLIDLN